MKQIPPEQLALEIEDIIRSMPGERDFNVNPDKCVPWLGRACAAISAWNSLKAIASFEPLVETLSRPGNNVFSAPLRKMLIILHQAKNDLRLISTGPLSVGIDAGRVFDYFDELRRVIEAAKIDILFVDPYIDAEFVSRYLIYVPAATNVRILTREKISTLRPAIQTFIEQTGRNIEIHSAPSFHDRYVFVDSIECFQSGASFKDGAKKAPTTLTQITDAFEAVRDTYEQIWLKSTIVTLDSTSR